LLPHLPLINEIKCFTFQRPGPFNFEIFYTNPEKLPEGTYPDLGYYKVIVEAAPDGRLRKIKVRARISLHGIFSVMDAQMIEEEEVQEKVKEKRLVAQEVSEPVPAATEGEEAPKAPVSPAPESYEYVDVVKTVRKTNRTKLEVQREMPPGWYREAELRAAKEAEVRMKSDDLVEAETREKMNELEAYVYRMRDKISGDLSNFLKAADKEALSKALQSTEEWLYDAIGSAKSVFVQKLKELQTLGEPAENRFSESIGRDEGVKSLNLSLAEWRHIAATSEDVDPQNRSQVLKRADEIEAWLHKELSDSKTRPLYEDSKLTAKLIKDTQAEFVESAKKGLAKKPVPVPEPTPAPETSSNNNPDVMETD